MEAEQGGYEAVWGEPGCAAVEGLGLWKNIRCGSEETLSSFFRVIVTCMVDHTKTGRQIGLDKLVGLAKNTNNWACNILITSTMKPTKQLEFETMNANLQV